MANVRTIYEDKEISLNDAAVKVYGEFNFFVDIKI